ncbi:two-component system, OmpR family, sensor histidine kinase KdpD [Nocardioides exalbidus]|uniref:histidine kinase n=1 Tax=Nocardioides exalbidus TaxID=402596 RepID=A0A1H4NHR7_9ACTN|nr:ATP-binding protein [Nocardioides exalbidus]SEB94654.1 two-component system, OmpR family, sensor histidine kinase KdpD [Nocardioides exalbidus]
MERGRLRVYLGAAPGVGKTYAMLDEGHRRLERGTDVVVGYVETHGRAKTEQAVGGLEVVPRRTLEHGGTRLEEMDLEAVLERSPEVVLVDELAHTNVPGSAHTKRWQDVEILRDAGIEVVTTINIQHLESLNDVTEQVTGVRQRETVPDHVVRSADQIELVDMSPQSLRRRMAHGNVYAADKIDAALSRYFREGNLTALRELALLWLADRVDEGLERYRDQHEIDSTWATRERIVVPVSGGPESSTLMRRAARIASRRSGGEWQALYVTRQDGLRGIAPDGLAALGTKAEELGGSFHTVVGDDPAEAILAFARAENATQVVIGASRRGRVSTVLRPGVGERVVAGSGDIDVHIVSHDHARQSSMRPPADNLGVRRRAVGFAVGVVVPVGLSALLYATQDLHGLPIEAMSLMMVVVATALIGGLVPAVLSALVSALLLNYLFTPPLYTLTIAEPENVVTIAIFVAVGIAVATVVDNAARRTAEARAARAEADALTVLAHSLLTASDDLPGLLSSACRLFNADGAAVLRRPPSSVAGEQVEVVASCGKPPTSVDRADMSAAIDDQSTLVLAGATLPATQRGLLNAYAAYAKVMDDRRLATLAEVERLRLTEVDRTRTALLQAVSHDLRNPLAAVKVSVDSLRSTDVAWSDEDRDGLLETIEESTDRLIALVGNLLDMSRISTGSVSVVLREVGLADAVRTSLAPLDGGSRIEVDVDAGLLVMADAGLLDRVLANICENALKYTPAAADVRVDAAADGQRVVVRIADSGPGVADQDRDRLFAPFQRFGDVPEKDGVGLGLAVARGLTEAMGGTIATEETPGGGLTFVLELEGAP